jgi:hypothetical protein
MIIRFVHAWLSERSRLVENQHILLSSALDHHLVPIQYIRTNADVQ